MKDIEDTEVFQNRKHVRHRGQGDMEDIKSVEGHLRFVNYFHSYCNNENNTSQRRNGAVLFIYFFR